MPTIEASPTRTNKTIKVDYLARVEGEGGLFVKIKNNVVQDVKLKIFEPPRFFEAFMRGRDFREAPDITARICGICPVAYQMSSIHAMEDAMGVVVTGPIRDLRRLLYCGEWIESHALHVYMLHAPDFLGYQDAIQLAKQYPEVVKRGLELKKIGNDLMKLIGGREIHPINVRVGGFYKVPAKRDLAAIAERLKWALDASIETVKLTASLNFPEFEQDYEFVALRHPDEYPLCEGRLVSNKGLDISVCEYEQHFVEEHVAHSNALQSRMIERGNYFCGPLARYSLNYDRLSTIAQQAARSVNLGTEVRNPFKSIVVRSVELVYACDEALRIINNYEVPEHPYIEVDPRTMPRRVALDYQDGAQRTQHTEVGVGHGVSEAPRGILYHRYHLDEKGMIVDAKITPPTSQNQKQIEDDLRQFVTAHLDLSDADLTWQCEQAVRNYDPCISCATHFLKLDLQRE